MKTRIINKVHYPIIVLVICIFFISLSSCLRDEKNLNDFYERFDLFYGDTRFIYNLKAIEEDSFDYDMIMFESLLVHFTEIEGESLPEIELSQYNTDYIYHRVLLLGLYRNYNSIPSSDDASYLLKEVLKKEQKAN